MKIILGNLLPLSTIAIGSLAKCVCGTPRRVPRTPARGARPPREYLENPKPGVYLPMLIVYSAS